MTPMPNAPSPNAIFGEALARTPAPEPLDVVLGRMTQTQGQALQNRQTRIEMASDQALRDAIKNHSRSVPVGAPPSSFPAEPTPGVDDAGNPVRDQGWHAAAASSSAQAPLADVNGVVRELNARGYGDRALTFLNSIQNFHTNNLNNLKTGLELDQKRNAEIGDRVESLLWLARPAGPNGPIDQDGLAKAAKAWPSMADELNRRFPGTNLPTTFDPDTASSIWRGKVGYDQILKRQLDTLTLGKTEAETGEARARTALTGTQAAISQRKLDMIDRAMKDPTTALTNDVDSIIDPKKNPDENRQARGLYLLNLSHGDFDGAKKAVQDIAEHITTSNETEARERRLRGVPQAVPPETQEYRGELIDLRNRERSDRSYQFNSTQLDRYAKPVSDLQTRMARLKDSLDQNSPQADTLLGPELLSIMSGGQGSGLRMNEAEIARIVGGRSKWESLKAAAQQWSPDPKVANSITPEQRQQIRDLAKAVQNRLDAKQQVIDDARDDLASSDDPVKHRRIVTNTLHKLLEADQGTQAGQGTPGPAAAAGAKTYTDADVQAAVNQHLGTASQIEAGFKAKGWIKR